MRVSGTLAIVGLSIFVVMFSSVAVAQLLSVREEGAQVHTVSRQGSGIREIPVFFPQGRLYCANGSLAYQRLVPQGWVRISAEDAVKVANDSVEDACLGGDPHLCKEYRSRLSKLRLAIRECF